LECCIEVARGVTEAVADLQPDPARTGRTFVQIPHDTADQSSARAWLCAELVPSFYRTQNRFACSNRAKSVHLQKLDMF
jgi:hypothetical protein